MLLDFNGAIENLEQALGLLKHCSGRLGRLRTYLLQQGMKSES